ncbi:MAG TPA: crotonase/enoyl-CoA hydratase family protein [Acidimicrobiales bacterium]|nr:crotonase/enoyl-CoA hydratase family protein [Acidimicrobiales bacterium]
MADRDDRQEASVLSLERDGHVATIFLDRPEKRNAMGMPFFAQLPRVMEELGRDDEVRAVVMAARGPAFSVGLDLTALAAVGADTHEGEPASAATVARRIHADVLRLQGAISSVADCPKPVVAAIHGWCIGGGVDLTSACDIRLCSADAIFSVRETRMAMVADIGSLARLPELMPYGYVAELAYTGKDVDAARAERMGFVNAVLPDAEATLRAARELAGEIAANSPLAVQGAKAVLAEGRRARVEASLRFVAAWNAGQLRSDDLTEAVTAFFERRPPKFSGG